MYEGCKGNYSRARVIECIKYRSCFEKSHPLLKLRVECGWLLVGIIETSASTVLTGFYA